MCSAMRVPVLVCMPHDSLKSFANSSFLKLPHLAAQSLMYSYVRPLRNWTLPSNLYEIMLQITEGLRPCRFLHLVLFFSLLFLQESGAQLKLCGCQLVHNTHAKAIAQRVIKAMLTIEQNPRLADDISAAQRTIEGAIEGFGSLVSCWGKPRKDSLYSNQSHIHIHK